MKKVSGKTHTQEQLNTWANQNNPNNKAYRANSNNHNGTISEEVRLIYVVHQRTGLPLFFRYAAGNVIDVRTLVRTIAELKANGVNTKFAILDAGYYTGANADALLDAKISFITRLKNFKGESSATQCKHGSGFPRTSDDDIRPSCYPENDV